MRVSALDNRHRQKIFQRLMEDVSANLYLIDILLRRGISSWGLEEWRGVFYNDRLEALSFTAGRLRPGTQSRLVVAWGNSKACELLGEKEQKAGGTRMILGPREPSDGIWRGMGSPRPRIHYPQRLYVCDIAPEGPTLPLRKAQLSELDDYAFELSNTSKSIGGTSVRDLARPVEWILTCPFM